MHIQRNTKVQFIRSVISDSLQPHGLQHSRPPCSSPTPELAPTHICRVLLILCHSPLLPPSISPNNRIFSNESVLPIRWPEEYSGLISFRMDWFDLLAVQGTLKSLLQHHCSRAPILWCSAFFMVQLSHPYMTTRKTTALTRWIFVGKVMSLVLNMLSRLAIAFLPGSKRPSISWLQSPSAVNLEPQK